MPNSCIRGSAKLPLAYQPIAHQLIVTHCGADPVWEHPPTEWEFSNPRFNRKKRSEISALAIDLDLAEIWLGHRLVNGANLSRISSF